MTPQQHNETTNKFIDVQNKKHGTHDPCFGKPDLPP